ncbi:MAG TPA: sigma-70 family RNA polymerase sigma factor [Candidatus Dormibacteraeota bacterium]|nr:sigma-70 family RNA polymerase sigma factor [Candidatus Dormibacteraeota bacterium]
MRSWLVRGIHPFAVAARRSGARRNANRVLGDDQRLATEGNGGWRELASALQRHTLHNALIHLDPEERHIVTLAYLQGRTNRQIAALLGISVSTVSRRLSQALDHLDEYVRRTRGWITATLLVGLSYLAARTGRVVNSAAAGDWTHTAATVVVGTVAVVSVGLVATSPDSAVSRHAAAPSAIKVVVSPWDVTRMPLAKIGPLGTTTATSTAPTAATSKPLTAITVAAPAPIKAIEATKALVDQPDQVSLGRHADRGCRGRPSDVDTEGSDHPEGPVVHLAAGGCEK